MRARACVGLFAMPSMLLGDGSGRSGACRVGGCVRGDRGRGLSCYFERGSVRREPGLLQRTPGTPTPGLGRTSALMGVICIPRSPLECSVLPEAWRTDVAGAFDRGIVHYCWIRAG